MIERFGRRRLTSALSNMRVVYLSGPRQAGKSTLARAVATAEHPAPYVSLDDPAARATAEVDPRGFLDDLGTPLVLDEAQLVPELLFAIKSVVDSDNSRGQFLLTGSANVLTSPKISESLAGRMQIVDLWPLSEAELSGGEDRFVDRLLAGDIPRPAPSTGLRPSLMERVVRGGFPEAVARQDDRERAAWFRSYAKTVTERDVRELASIQRLAEIPHLLALLATRVGGLLNVASIARDTGVPQSTVNRYLALLHTIFLVQFVPAYAPRNFGKRLIKAPNGYPELTRELKAKVLGLNGARVYGVEPTTRDCKFTRDELEDIRRQVGGTHATHGPRNAAEVAIIREHHRGWPG